MSLKLGDIVKIERGTTYKSALLDLPGPVLLGLASIQRHGGFREDSLRTYGGESPDSLLVKPGEIYASLKDVTQTADLLGAVARLPSGSRIGRLTQDTVRLDVRDGQVSTSYLHWILRTPHYREYCRGNATGTTTMGLPRTSFLAYEVPELNAARGLLVNLLDALDDKISANDLVLRVASRLAVALYERSLTAGARDAVVGDVAEFHNRRRVPLSSRDREDRQGAVPYYGAAGRVGFVDEALFDGELVLVGEDGTVMQDDGRPIVQYVWGPSWVNNHAHVLTGIGISTELLRWAIERESVAHIVTGAVQPKISMGNLKSLAVSIPADMSVVEIEVQGLAAATRARSVENERLTSTRDELLPLLMSGTLCVKDAQKLVEEVV